LFCCFISDDIASSEANVAVAYYDVVGVEFEASFFALFTEFIVLIALFAMIKEHSDIINVKSVDSSDFEIVILGFLWVYRVNDRRLRERHKHR
jgi:hypothetical protein